MLESSRPALLATAAASWPEGVGVCVASSEPSHSAYVAAAAVMPARMQPHNGHSQEPCDGAYANSCGNFTILLNFEAIFPQVDLFFFPHSTLQL